MSFDFLASIRNMQPITVAATEKTAAVRTSVDKTPAGNCIRLFKDGSVFPSASLLEVFALDYMPQNSETVGNGFDVFEAKNLPGWPSEAPNGLLIGAAPKNAGKVDLFAATRFDAEGNPVASVMTQGSTTFGKESLIPMLERVLNQESSEIFKDSPFVDLTVMIDTALPIAGDALYIPKTVKKGKNAGEQELVRRTNFSVYPFVYLTEEVQTELQTESAPQNEESPASHTESPEVTPQVVVE